MTSVECSVVELWRYPVKSMRGERLDRAELRAADHRIPGDREWGVFDAATGKLLSAKSVGALLAGCARFRDDGVTEIELPDGATLIAGTPDADRAIGAWLGRAVTLRRAGGATATIDMELDDGDGAGPSGLSSFATAPGLLFDSKSTLHLVSTATLAGFDREHHAGAGDVRRFRPNLVVDGIEALAEDGWVDADVRIGGVTAHVRKRTERCVIVSRAQPGVEQDRGLLRHLVSRHAMRVGVYLDPRAAGEVAVGDRVARVDPR